MNYLKDALVKEGYQSKTLDHHFERAMIADRKILLPNKDKPSTQRNLPLVLTFNKTLPNIKNVIDKYWHTLSLKFLIKDRSLSIEEIIIHTN